MIQYGNFVLTARASHRTALLVSRAVDSASTCSHITALLIPGRTRRTILYVYFTLLISVLCCTCLRSSCIHLNSFLRLKPMLPRGHKLKLLLSAQYSLPTSVSQHHWNTFGSRWCK